MWTKLVFPFPHLKMYSLNDAAIVTGNTKAKKKGKKKEKEKGHRIL